MHTSPPPIRQVTADSYDSSYPLVTSVGLFKIRLGQRRPDWSRNEGVIVNGSITIQGGRIYFVESRNLESLNDEDGRITVGVLLESEAYIVALDAQTGEKIMGGINRSAQRPQHRLSRRIRGWKTRVDDLGRCAQHDGPLFPARF